MHAEWSFASCSSRGQSMLHIHCEYVIHQLPHACSESSMQHTYVLQRVTFSIHYNTIPLYDIVVVCKLCSKFVQLRKQEDCQCMSDHYWIATKFLWMIVNSGVRRWSCREGVQEIRLKESCSSCSASRHHGQCRSRQCEAEGWPRTLEEHPVQEHSFDLKQGFAANERDGEDDNYSMPYHSKTLHL